MTVLVRTTGTTAEFGADGGSLGQLHIVGLGPDDTGSEAPRGQLVPANTWVTLNYDIPNESSRLHGFSALGGSLADPRGVLESLGITPFSDAGISTTYYVDNFTVIPEPSTYAAVFGGLAMLGACVYRRR